MEQILGAAEIKQSGQLVQIPSYQARQLIGLSHHSPKRGRDPLTQHAHRLG